MAAQPGGNEGFRVLDDFVCDAIAGPEGPGAGSLGRGASAGIHVVSEFMVSASAQPLAEGRKTELRKLSSSELLAIVQLTGPQLTPEELRFIHDLAIERLTQSGGPFPEGTDALSREVMQLAVRRIA